ncbi:hypothetical protein AMTR_s00027p00189970 [Amborella trichopoda]|uniref:Uncharacterized protein n=1 Tax=Amborella trichopoda TaxID=13333 RepID=W1PRV2_AMBTC|nr:hypothetical protein AMTR_s00027p00189970 [Amborella trichopoda]
MPSEFDDGQGKYSLNSLNGIQFLSYPVFHSSSGSTSGRGVLDFMVGVVGFLGSSSEEVSKVLQQLQNREFIGESEPMSLLRFHP